MYHRWSRNTMVHTLVTSWLDYCNALMYGLPGCLLNKLWCVQKSSARLITMRWKYDHISPVMEDVHWLPIWERITYKVLILTYKSLKGLAPQYVSDLLERRPEWGTRRDNKNFLVNWQLLSVAELSRKLHKICGTTYQTHFACPPVSNSLREDLRHFFVTLCTHHARWAMFLALIVFYLVSFLTFVKHLRVLQFLVLYKISHYITYLLSNIYTKDHDRHVIYGYDTFRQGVAEFT